MPPQPLHSSTRFATAGDALALTVEPSKDSLEPSRVSLHPRAMAARGISMGDLVLVDPCPDAGGPEESTGGQAFARLRAASPLPTLAFGECWPSTEGGEQALQLSAQLRQNAGVVVGQTAEVHTLRGAVYAGQIVVAPAAACTVVQLGPTTQLCPGLRCYLHSFLDGMHVMLNHEFTLSMLGLPTVFRVTALRPGAEWTAGVGDDPEGAKTIFEIHSATTLEVDTESEGKDTPGGASGAAAGTEESDEPPVIIGGESIGRFTTVSIGRFRDASATAL